MCWTNINNETFIANTNIHVFKIARIKKTDNKIHPYFQDKNGIEYEENKTYRCGANGFVLEHCYAKGLKTYMVNKAMHSYSIENIRLFHAYNTVFYVGTYNACPQYYYANDAVIMLCTIPKGTRYAVNSVGEIVSDEIRVEKIITNSFTFNKDSSLSKMSLKNINKILNNWENEKRMEI